MLKKVALVAAGLVVALLLFATTRPDTFRVQRDVVVQAPSDKVFLLVNDFHNWPSWSPWEKLDPSMQRTHGGAPSGKGATYAWEGNDKVGSGRMEITDASPSKISIALDFLKPFEAHNVSEFSFEPQGAATHVTWVMHGPANFVTKVMCIFVSMDSMIGKDFESGLANMKAAAEKS